MYKFDEYAETYAGKHIRRFIISMGHRLCYSQCFDLQSEILKQEISAAGVTYKLRYNCDMSYSDFPSEVRIEHNKTDGKYNPRKTKEKNPVLWLIISRYKEKYKETLDLRIEGYGRDRGIHGETKVAESLEEIVEFLHEDVLKYNEGVVRGNEEYLKRIELQQRKEAVKFKTDPDYYLVKPE